MVFLNACDVDFLCHATSVWSSRASRPRANTERHSIRSAGFLRLLIRKR